MGNEVLTPQRRADLLIDAPKTMAGQPKWQPMEYEGQWRWLISLEVEGEGCGLELLVDAWPSSPIKKFVITLNLGSCVSRIDASPHERHNNHKVKGKYFPYEATQGWIFGAHYHPWRLNRHLSKLNSLPAELEFAILLPANVQGFENTFRWFCGENRIACSVDEAPSLPTRDFLV